MLKASDSNVRTMQELQGGMVGINVYSFGVYPFSDSSADKEAAKRIRDFYVGW